MQDVEIIWTIEEFVKGEMEWVCSAHDFFHIERVVKLANKLRELEGRWDALIIHAWALLHESLDDKFFNAEDISHRKQEIKRFLSSLSMSDEVVWAIMFIIENVGFGKSLERWDDFSPSVEFEIVEDADRLEAVWAIAIARTFAYGWKKKRAIYDPDVKPQKDLTRQQYAKSENTSVNHFYEKLLLLKDMMHTMSWTRIAQERHAFMEEYLKQFFKERNVEL